MLDCVDFLVAHEGAKVTWLEATPDGRVEPETVRAAIETEPESVALVSVMWANNEVGTVQDVPGIAAVAREHGIPFHTDAVQAGGPPARRLRRERSRPALGDGAQARWPDRGRARSSPGATHGSCR